MWRPVKNSVIEVADSLALKYLDELGLDFIPAVVASWAKKRKRSGTGLTLNVRTHYRSILADFCRVARENDWTDRDLAKRLEKPARGKAHTKPVDPTVPFDLDS